MKPKTKIIAVVAFALALPLFSEHPSLSEYTEVTVEEKNEAMNARVCYPVFNRYPELSAAAKDILMGEFEETVREAEAWYRENSDEEWWKDSRSLIRVRAGVSDSDGIIAVTLCREVFFAGAAHGTHGVFSFLAYDTNRLAFTDITEVCQMSADEIARFCYDALPDEAEYKDRLLAADRAEIARLPFILSSDHATVLFSPETVAPYRAGGFELFIPIKKEETEK